MLQSKLPNIGTTIFTVMSQMAHKYGAINLSQGFPDFEVSPELIEGVGHHMKIGHNQYAPMPGLPQLREQIANKLSLSYGHQIDEQSEVTVTGGATEALYSVITALVQSGDEVIVFEPAYDSYEPVIQLNQGKVVRIKLQFPEFTIPWHEVNDLVSNKTKLIIINTPHNPTGSVLSSGDLDELQKIVQKWGLYVLSDEVYEHIIFDQTEHQSVLRYDGLKEHAVAVYSFGKTFHATGWKIGYAIAPSDITKEIRRVHQFLNFSVNTPMQWALSDYLKDPDNYQSVAPFYQAKRDTFLSLIKESRFKPIPCKGTYFQSLIFEDISTLGDVEMAEKMTSEHGVASIPISVFYHDNRDDKVLRFCFAKKDETLEKAAEILCKI